MYTLYSKILQKYDMCSIDHILSHSYRLVDVVASPDILLLASLGFWDFSSGRVKLMDLSDSFNGLAYGNL